MQVNIYKSYLLLLIIFSSTLLFISSCSSDDDDDSNSSTIKINNLGHEYVDLGLSVYWAPTNLNANNSTNPGYKYAFGERTSKSEFTATNYIGGDNDVVKQQWGGDWRLPSYQEYSELVQNCTWKLNTRNGVEVVTATGPNGNTIDFPFNTYIKGEGYKGWYWSGTSYNSSSAYCFHFDASKGEVSCGTNSKYNGFLIRGVITNPNYKGNSNNSGGNSGGSSTGGGTNGGNTNQPKDFNESYCDYTQYTTKIDVKFYFTDRVASATIKYGTTSSCSSSKTANVTGVCASATITGLKPGTKYYFKCIAKSKDGQSCTTGVYPIMTMYQ